MLLFMVSLFFYKIKLLYFQTTTVFIMIYIDISSHHL
jgi:hypothetical protein